jgi:hypothetical protein
MELPPPTATMTSGASWRDPVKVPEKVVHGGVGRNALQPAVGRSGLPEGVDPSLEAKPFLLR